ERIFKIIEVGEEDKYSKVYDFFMMATIIISIIPLCTHSVSMAFFTIDKVTVSVFIIDYLLRLITADFKLKRGALSFLLYPFTPMAIIDLLSILPSITILTRGLRLLRIFRLLRTFRVFRVFKAFRYSKNINMVIHVFKKQKDSLIVVCGFAIAYILISALVIFNAEPETFPTMFEAIYWATISLTTVGYGDVYATSAIGKFITMISAVLGIAIVALPAGIIIAGYQEELEDRKRDTTE
ncbi:MAG: ion transporter, partial [Butyrivibrio sp.]|nr:ion transporter [Butyrivibrio sp.]